MFGVGTEPVVLGAEANVQQAAGASGHVTSMYCDVATAPGAGNGWDFILRLNAAGVGNPCNIADLATSCNVTGLSVAFSAGDLLDIGVLVSSATPAASAASCGVGVGP